MEPWIPLLQSLVWPLLVVGVLVAFRRPLGRILDSVRARVDAGADLEVAGPAGLRARLGGLVPVEAGDASGEPAAAPDQAWTAQRHTIRQESRDVFLTHVVGPSDVPGQRFEVFTFLVGHRRSRHGYPEDLSDVERAEFFLGRGWANRVFDVARRPGEQLGIRTHAYGPVLCLCRVHFTDGATVVISRYLDVGLAASPE